MRREHPAVPTLLCFVAVSGSQQLDRGDGSSRPPAVYQRVQCRTASSTPDLIVCVMCVHQNTTERCVISNQLF